MRCGISTFPYRLLYLQPTYAQVAKLVDALPSGGSVRKDVLVRIQSWALIKTETLVKIELDKGFNILGNIIKLPGIKIPIRKKSIDTFQ